MNLIRIENTVASSIGFTSVNTLSNIIVYKLFYLTLLNSILNNKEYELFIQTLF